MMTRKILIVYQSNWLGFWKNDKICALVIRSIGHFYQFFAWTKALFTSIISLELEGNSSYFRVDKWPNTHSNVFFSFLRLLAFFRLWLKSGVKIKLWILSLKSCSNWTVSSNSCWLFVSLCTTFWISLWVVINWICYEDHSKKWTSSRRFSISNIFRLEFVAISISSLSEVILSLIIISSRSSLCIWKSQHAYNIINVLHEEEGGCKQGSIVR